MRTALPAGFAKQTLTLALCCTLSSMPLSAGSHIGAKTTTPIKHIVVIFQENRSFDQYFATSPYAANLPGENPFSGHAADSDCEWGCSPPDC
jgi:phospholipase C